MYPYFISTNWQLLRREDPTPACGVLLKINKRCPSMLTILRAVRSGLTFKCCQTSTGSFFGLMVFIENIF